MISINNAPGCSGWTFRMHTNLLLQQLRPNSDDCYREGLWLRQAFIFSASEFNWHKILKFQSFPSQLQLVILPLGSLKNLDRNLFLAGPGYWWSWSRDRSWGWSVSEPEYDPASWQLIGDLDGDLSVEVTQTSSDPCEYLLDEELISDLMSQSGTGVNPDSFLAGQERSRGCIWTSTMLTTQVTTLSTRKCLISSLTWCQESLGNVWQEMPPLQIT